MKRREFLQIAAVAGISRSGSGIPPRAERSHEVMTVLGSLPAERLGKTLIHEHILVDFVGADKIGPGRYDPEDVRAKALPRLRDLRQAGCTTLVECTPNFLGRDPALLQRLARDTGLNILTNTGLYGAAQDKYVPAFAFRESAEQLAERWTREAKEGIPPSGIKPGFIKIGVDAGSLSAIDAKLVRAAGLTHKRTGLVIASHTGDGTAALAQLDLLRAMGVAPEGFIWVHAQNETDPEIHKNAAALGAWVEFDGIRPQTTSKFINLVMAMKRAGHLPQVLISQDSGWYHVGEPQGGDFRPYTGLITEFLPALLEGGATPEDVSTLLVDNPRSALCPP